MNLTVVVDVFLVIPKFQLIIPEKQASGQPGFWCPN
jgi:hypothetical protein